MKAIIVLAQYGGRRYVVATPDSEAEAISIASSLNTTEKAKTRTPGQAMTRYRVYKLVEDHF